MKILIAILFCLTSLFVSCKKETNRHYYESENFDGSKSNLTEIRADENKTYSRDADSDTLVQQLMDTYGLVVLSPEQVSGLELPQYSDFESASNYIEEIINTLNQGSGGMLGTSTMLEYKFADPPPPGGCTAPNTYYATLNGTAGLFSNFRISFAFNGSAITSSTVWVTGTPLFWTWGQENSLNTGTTGCVDGTLTWGVVVGNITLGFSENYHFNYTFDPVGCTLTYSSSRGHC